MIVCTQSFSYEIASMSSSARLLYDRKMTFRLVFRNARRSLTNKSVNASADTTKAQIDQSIMSIAL